MADTHTINDPHINITPTKINTNLENDLSLNSSGFLSHNGFHNHNSSSDVAAAAAAAGYQISDIEMIALQAATYTSLRDLLPASPTPAIMSPTHNSSWYEIPIKNPLVKQAALAYLQPMSSPPEVGEKGFLGKLKDMCCCQCECFGWINHVVFRGVKEVFWDRRDEEIDEDEEDEEKLD